MFSFFSQVSRKGSSRLLGAAKAEAALRYGNARLRSAPFTSLHLPQPPRLPPGCGAVPDGAAASAAGAMGERRGAAVRAAAAGLVLGAAACYCLWRGRRRGPPSGEAGRGWRQRRGLGWERPRAAGRSRRVWRGVGSLFNNNKKKSTTALKYMHF